jgi:hypothetical protein
MTTFFYAANPNLQNKSARRPHKRLLLRKSLSAATSQIYGRFAS